MGELGGDSGFVGELGVDLESSIGGPLVGEAEGVNLNGLVVSWFSTSSNCERLDVGLVLEADG